MPLVTDEAAFLAQARPNLTMVETIARALCAYQSVEDGDGACVCPSEHATCVALGLHGYQALAVLEAVRTKVRANLAEPAPAPEEAR